jgi:uncharacterized GH25 family protein
MSNYKKMCVLTVMVLTFLIPGPIFAATLWLEPSSLRPAEGEAIEMHLFLGERFTGDERALDAERVVSFQRLDQKSRRHLDRTEGQLPVASFKSGSAGVEIVALTWQGLKGAYFCKTIQVVGDAEPGHPLRFSELGQRLELVPQTDPVLLSRRGGTFEVQVLFEREPLAGVRLLALPKGDAVEGALTAVTNEIGVATFELERPGGWLIEVAHKAGGDRTRATLVLGVGKP